MDQGTIERVRQAKRGDKEALLALIMAQKQDFYRLAYVYMKNEHDALDALEDMIVRIYENIGKLKDERAFYSWSKTILVNCCKHSLRQSRKVIPTQFLPEGSYEDTYLEKEQLVLDQHWAKLNPKYQDVLKLRFYLDMEYDTIAKILQIPLGTVKSRIHTGLQKLKQSMGVTTE